MVAQPFSPADGEPDTEAPDPNDGGRRPWYQSVGKVVATIIIGATFLVWVYALSGAARRDAPDLLDDATFATEAEAICHQVVTEIDALPGALDAVDGADRGRQLIVANNHYEIMLDDLQAHVGGTDRDVQITEAWLADWEVLIQDRYRYAEAVATDPGARFLITDLGYQEGLERRITRFATTNAMASCGAPGDIG